MRVLDATFLVEYLNGHPDTEAYYEANGGPEQRWVIQTDSAYLRLQAEVKR